MGYRQPRQKAAFDLSPETMREALLQTTEMGVKLPPIPNLLDQFTDESGITPQNGALYYRWPNGYRDLAELLGLQPHLRGRQEKSSSFASFTPNTDPELVKQAIREIGIETVKQAVRELEKE